MQIDDDVILVEFSERARLHPVSLSSMTMEEMGYYWGKLDAEEVLGVIDGEWIVGSGKWDLEIHSEIKALLPRISGEQIQDSVKGW